jgi:MFS family permease
VLSLLRQRDFARFTGAAFLSSVGDGVLSAALPFHVYVVTGSVLATTAMFMARIVPSLVLAPFAGVLVDRWDRRTTQIWSDFARGAVVAGLAVAQSVDTVWLVYLLAFMESSVSQVARPAVAALVPALVGREELARANSVSSVRWHVSLILGFPLGGALLAIAGFPFVVIIDATSYIVSGVLLLGIKPHAYRFRASSPKPSQPNGGFRDQLIEGFRAVAMHRRVAFPVIVFGVLGIASGVVNPLLAPFVKTVLDGGPIEFGWLAASQGVGGMAGGILLGRFWHTARRSAVVLGSIGVGFGLFLMANVHVFAIPLLGLAAIPAVVGGVTLQTILQEASEDRLRGRVFAVLGTISGAVVLLGAGISGVLGDRVGIVPTISLGAAIFVGAGITALFCLPSGQGREIA